MRLRFLVVAFTLGAAARAGAQAAPGPSIVVDRVVGVVGNKPILASQVDEDLFSRQAQGVKLPEGDSAAMAVLRLQVLNDLINQELLVQEALRDTSIKVTDQEVVARVEAQIKRVRAGFTSELDYRNELKKAGFGTPEEYRRWLMEQQRRAALQEALMTSLRDQQKLKPVAPTEAQMRDVLRDPEGRARQAARHHLVPPDRRGPAAGLRRQGPGAAVGRFDRLCASAGGGLRHRGPALQHGPGLARTGRLAGLAPARAAPVSRFREGGLRVEGRRDFQPGRDRVRLPHHPGAARATRRDRRPPHPDHAGGHRRGCGDGARAGRHRGDRTAERRLDRLAPAGRSRLRGGARGHAGRHDAAAARLPGRPWPTPTPAP